MAVNETVTDGVYSDDGNWDQSHEPIATEDVIIGDNITADADALATPNEFDIYTTESLDISTYTFTYLGNCDIRGTLIIGISASTGFTGLDIDLSDSNAELDMQDASVIRSERHFEVDDSNIFTSATSAGKAYLIGTTAGNIENPDADNKLDYFEITETAKVATLLDDFVFTNNFSADGFTNNGTIVGGAYGMYIGCNSTGVVALGADSDITGSADVYWRAINNAGGNVTNAQTTAQSFSGNLRVYGRNPQLTIGPVGNWANAELIIRNDQSAGALFMHGTLIVKCMTVAVTAGTSLNFYWDNYTGILELVGDGETSDMNSVATATVNYFNTLGYIAVETNHTIDTAGQQDLPKFLIDAGGTDVITFNGGASIMYGFEIASGIAELEASVITYFITGIAAGATGTLRSSSAGVQAEVSWSTQQITTPIMDAGTIKDIAINGGDSSKVLNCKTCTNAGNNDERLIFEDAFGSF